jgi:hypothetical protein
MPIIGPAWSSDLLGRLSAKGFSGSYLSVVTTAVGQGSQLAVVGKPFSTTDIGTIPGVGVGTGVGVTGLSASTISSEIFSNCVSTFGQSGAKLQDFCDAMAASCVAQMALATLTSAHTPVFAGVGTVVVGSIGVVPAGWGSSIAGLGSAAGLVGSQWNNWANAIGKGHADGVKNTGTGTVTIVGSPTSPTPVPGAGTGTGTIS